MANDYTTLDTVKASFVDSTTYATSSDFDVALSAMITAASRLIDRYVGRWDGFFNPSTDPETRYYDGSGGPSQDIDEFLSLTFVGVSAAGGVQSSDYDTWATTDYFIEPYNAAGLGRPYRTITADIINGQFVVFYRFPRSVKITGTFGWSLTTPADVGEAAKIQVVRWFMRAKQGYMDQGAGAGVPAGPPVIPQSLDPDVKAILNKYVLELAPQ